MESVAKENRIVEFIRNNIQYLWIIAAIFGKDYFDLVLKPYLPEYLEYYSSFFSFFAVFNIMLLLIAVDFPFFSRFNVKPKRFLWSNLILLCIFIASLLFVYGISLFTWFLPNDPTDRLVIVMIVGISLFLIGVGVYFVQKMIEKGKL
jgi:hypothetical protein